MNILENEAVMAAAKKSVELFFNWWSNREHPCVSTGLAVGYYYNFLRPLGSVLERGEFTLYAAVPGSSPLRFRSQGKFKLAGVRLQILLPSRLDEDSLKHSEDHFDTFRKGFFYSPENRRHHGVNYSVRKLAAGNELTLVDFARPLACVEWFYQHTETKNRKRLDTGEQLEKWQKIQAVELAAFEKSIETFLRETSSVLKGKIDFITSP